MKNIKQNTTIYVLKYAFPCPVRPGLRHVGVDGELLWKPLPSGAIRGPGHREEVDLGNLVELHLWKGSLQYHKYVITINKLQFKLYRHLRSKGLKRSINLNVLLVGSCSCS